MIFFLTADRLRNDVNTANYSTHVRILEDEQSMTANDYSCIDRENFGYVSEYSIPNDHYDYGTSGIGADDDKRLRIKEILQEASRGIWQRTQQFP